MKTYLAALLFFTTPASAQQNPPVDYTAVAGYEKAAQQRASQFTQGRFSIASNNFDVHFYSCRWQVDPAVRYIRGSVTAHFTTTVATVSLTFDLQAALTVDSIRYHNQATGFEHTSDALVIQLPQTLAKQQDSVTIFYQGIPVNDGLGSFVTASQSGTPVMWTLSEPYGAKDWWPCKNASTDKADSIDIRITYPARYHSSSNGLLANQTESNGMRTDYWKHRYPIAAYLVAIAVTDYVTDYDSVRIGTIMLPVRMYAYPSHTAYFKQATAIAKGCLQKFSELFGLYPFISESYGQTQFGVGGGMEHQTNSFIGANGTHLVAHELGHQWFGDKVTCGNWQDIWLNEGFATYMQAIYVENFEPVANLQGLIDAVRNIVVSAPGGSLKVNDTVKIERIFDNRLTYNKGFYVVHMLRWRLGDTLFFRAMRQYLSDPRLAYGTAVTADLQRNIEAVSGQNFTDFFKSWYEGEGFPSYQVQWAQTTSNQITINIAQTTSHPSVPFYAMPVPIRFSSRGKDTTVVLSNIKNNQQFVVNPGFAADTAVFDPKGWLLSANNSVTKVARIVRSDYQVRVLRNPLQGDIILSIANPAGKKASLQLLNAAGQLLYTKDVVLNGMDIIVNIPASHLPQGIYLLNITGDGMHVVKRLIR